MAFYDSSLIHVIINELKILSARISDLKLERAVNYSTVQ